MSLEHCPDGSEISTCNNVPVCKNLFIKTFCISSDRVQLLAKKRGKRKAELFTEKRKSVNSFIKYVPLLLGKGG